MRSPESAPDPTPSQEKRFILRSRTAETFALREGEKVVVTIGDWAFIYIKRKSEWKFSCGQMVEVEGASKGTKTMRFDQRIEDVSIPEGSAINVGTDYPPLSIIQMSGLAPLLFRITMGQEAFTIIALTDQKTKVQIRA